MEEEDGKEYRWETGYEKTWEAIRDDESGRIQEASVAEIIEKEKRKRQELKTGNRRLGLMRHVYLIIDCSEAMLDQDLSPNRQLCTVKLLEGFLDEFFEQNPIAQMGVIVTRNKRAEKLSDLAGISRRQKEVVKSIGDLVCTGQPSLQNALELAAKSLKLRPPHASREVIAIMANLTTCDPGNVADTIKFMKEENIRCSVIGLAAEVYVYKTLTKETKGTYSVILDDTHFRDQLFQQIDPPALGSNLSASLIKMGFPHHSLQDDKSSLGLCMCHLEEAEVKLKSDGYKCPQCAAKYCELPVECKVCGLTLVSAPHLARTFHHLFPVESFERTDGKNYGGRCYGCQKKFTEVDNYVCIHCGSSLFITGVEKGVYFYGCLLQLYTCRKCGQHFCAVCDIFVHDSLRTCPGCATNPNLFQNRTASFNASTSNS